MLKRTMLSIQWERLAHLIRFQRVQEQTLRDSNNYQSMAISSVLNKILDRIKNENDAISYSVHVAAQY